MRYFFLTYLMLMCAVADAQSGRHWYHNIDHDNVAIGGYDPVAYHTRSTAVKGSEKFSTAMGGVNYWFASRANLQRFKKTPEKYLPAFGGWCTFFMGIDKAATGFPPTRMHPDPENFKIIAGKLYLFRKTPQQDFKKVFEAGDPGAILKRANRFWQTRVAYSRKADALPEGMNPMARMELLDWAPFMGKWKTKAQWWTDTTGTSTYQFDGEWEFNYGYYGFCIMDDFRAVPDQPFAGTQNGPAIRGYDVVNEEWHMTYIPVNQPRSATWLMTGKFMGKGHLEGQLETRDPYGNDILQKVIFRLIDKDRFEWQAQWSWDGGKTWKEKTGFATAQRIDR